jgi:F-type H+-transporting ATPase subunit b
MDIQLPQIIFQIINFSVVMGALTYLLYKPLLKVLEERQKRVEEAQRAAEESLRERNRISELEKEVINTAEQKAADILEKARENAKAAEKDLLAKAKQQAEAEIDKMTLSWEEEKKQHLTDMKNEFVSTVVTTAEKVLGEKLDAKKQEKLIDTQLKTLLETI